MARKKYRVSTDDYFRVMLTETLPYEVPLIFGNEGIYDFYKTASSGVLSVPELLSEILGVKGDVKHKKPFRYKISKDIDSTRELSLIHPAAQKVFVDFYKAYDSLILYNCSKSEYSIRYPKKITSAVYKSNNEETYNLLSTSVKPLKEHSIDIFGEDKKNKFSSNYFSYRKFDVLYKFFESSEFIKLENRFPYMTCIDVSRCFDTIYTHSISWAVKGKDFIKESIANGVRNPNSFDDIFDVNIRKANDNETNGIVIGPEFSRIYSEIIFQRVDNETYLQLKERGLIHNRDYAIRRYIDDIYIFSKTKDKEEMIVNEVVNNLWEFKFRINPAKTKRYNRPFTTERSRNIIDLRSKINSEFSRLVIKKENDEGHRYLVPKLIKNPIRESTSFIKDIKSLWSSETRFSNYVLSSLRSVYVEIVRHSRNAGDELNGHSIVNFSIFLIEIAHYCFALSPRVSESYKLCHLMIVMSRFVRSRFQNHVDKLNHRIHNCLLTLLKNELSGQKVCGVERLNVLLTLSEIDRQYLPSSEIISGLVFDTNNSNDYFNVIVALFIARDDQRHENIRATAIEQAKKSLINDTVCTLAQNRCIYFWTFSVVLTLVRMKRKQ